MAIIVIDCGVGAPHFTIFANLKTLFNILIRVVFPDTNRTVLITVFLKIEILFFNQLPFIVAGINKSASDFIVMKIFLLCDFYDINSN